MKFQLKVLSAVVATLGSTLAFSVHAQSITVTSYGGAYGKSQIEAVHKPFTAKTGVKVLSEDYNGGLAEVRASHHRQCEVGCGGRRAGRVAARL